MQEDKITLKGIVLHAYHGLLEEEKKLGTKLIIDIELFLDLNPAAMSDKINNTVDYRKVYNLVNNINRKKKYNLIEAFGDRIAEQILSQFKNVKKVRIEIKKQPPMEGFLEYISCILERERK